jgi:hypothetical protein
LLIEEPPPHVRERFDFFAEWTRTQRTAAAIPVLVTIIDAGSSPVYLAIATKAHHLRELGLSDRRIAHAIGVSDKTVAKSLQPLRADEGLANVDDARDHENK